MGSGVGRRISRPEPVEATMRGRKNPPLDLTPVPEGTPLTFDVLRRACAAGGAAHAVRPSHPALRGAVSGRPGLSAAASGRADVAEPRVTAMKKKVIVTDRMQPFIVAIVHAAEGMPTSPCVRSIIIVLRT